MRKKRLVLILANLTAFGPFLTDIYLPALPEMTTYFSGSPSLVQLSLTAGMVGLAAGQLVIGPLADKFGRKWPLVWCLGAFVLATAGCMVSTSLPLFLFFRLMQGLTGSSGLVISKAMVTDAFPPHETARVFAVLGSVQGASPIAAPVVGGVIISLACWQGTFAALGLWGVALFLACRKMRDTLYRRDRVQVPVWKTLAFYPTVCRNAKFTVMNLLQGAAAAALLSYVSASPFVFQEHFGLSPLAYSVLFACNAMSLVTSAAFVMKIRRLGRALAAVVIAQFAASLLMAAALTLDWGIVPFEICLLVMLAGVGMNTPLGVTAAMNAVSEHRGVAAALVGSTPYVFGAIVAPLSGIGNILHSMSVLVVVCSTATFLLWLVSRRWDYYGEMGGTGN